MIAPTIIVGLGGIGSEIAARVAQHSKSSPQAKRLRFVCIDTDVNDLRKRKEADSSLITIQTSAPYVVSSYLDKNSKAREEWFPVHNILRGKTPTEGAGQVRAISRLAFDEAIREGRLASLDRAIEELYYLDGNTDPQAIRVIIVSTLAGGTGSGIVLPTALYIRHFLETRFKKSASVIRGFFLLPEIMFGNKSPDECGSLCCNAYASMRELDAFMRRGDGALVGPKYKDLKLELPEAKSGSYQDYKVTPFNYCFLYDKRNTNDLQLKSIEDYKEHAANTIYAQAVSGISSRSNSNEDNTIKPLVASNGRNRFCGAGSSLLSYPRDSVLEYVAGGWCLENMDEKWLRVDRAYKEHLADIKQQQKKNPDIKPEERKSFYLNYFSKPAKGSFEETVKDMVVRKSIDEEGYEVESSLVDEYMDELEKYIKETIVSEEVTSAANVAQANIEKLAKEDEKTDFVEQAVATENANNYYRQVFFKNARTRGRMIAQQLFKDSANRTGTKELYRIEGILKDEDGKFLHPNAVRLFVYDLLDRIQAACERIPQELEDEVGTLYPFDNTETPEIEHVKNKIDELMNTSLVRKKIIRRLSNTQEADIIGSLTEQKQAIEQYAQKLAFQIVFEAAVEYLSKLSSAFEQFYQSYPIYLGELKKNNASIQERFVNGEGKATRYVCADEKCLDELSALMECTSENANVNGDLSASIFQEMKEYSLMIRKPNSGTFFRELFEETICGFWKGRVAETYPMYLDMDIITALEAEVDFETDGELTSREKENRVARILREAERLAEPFIEEPRGELRHPFTICCYHPDVETGKQERTEFVRSYLNERLGGSPDPYVSRYELLIYKAIYNMNAGDLMRFNAPREKNGFGGEYYNAYLDVIRKLSPKTETNSVISPHLDRKWHLPKCMPDLDDTNQALLEKNVYTSIVWGLLTGSIEQEVSPNLAPSSRRSLRYVTYYPANSKSGEFIISNGTFCDELYEVVDGMAINLPQVYRILEEYEKVLRDEKDDRKSLAESSLINSLNWFDPAIALGDDYEPELLEAESETSKFKLPQFIPNTMNPSIFDLLYWIKQSTPVEDFEENELAIILESMIGLIEEYVSQFVSKERRYDRCYAILADQFQLFMRNLSDEKSIPYPRRRLHDSAVRLIRNLLDEHFSNNYIMVNRPNKPMQHIHNQAMHDYENASNKN